MIADGLEELSGKIIRIGHMGTSATPGVISSLIDALSESLASVKG